MSRDILIAVAAGLACAVLHLATEWGPLGALVLALAAPLPLFAAGLGLGLARAVLAGLVAMVTVAAVAGLPRAALFAATDAVPVLMVVRFALLNRQTEAGGIEWYPPGHLLTWLTLYCAGAFLALAAVLGQGLEVGISEYVEQFRAFMGGNEGPAVERMLATLKGVFPFLVVSWWVIILAVNGVVAQKLLARAGRARRPSPDLTATAPMPWLLPAAVAAAAVALVGSGWLGFVATNTALILCVPYFLTGLAVLHAISVRWSGRTAILIAAYLLLLLFGWPLIVVTGLGMVEHWAGLRRRFAGLPGQGNERNE